jgi:Na+/proline symporter
MLLVWPLTAGEVYTTFTFHGASGWAYSEGRPVLYILAYQPLMNVVAFFILPQESFSFYADAIDWEEHYAGRGR